MGGAHTGAGRKLHGPGERGFQRSEARARISKRTERFRFPDRDSLQGNEKAAPLQLPFLLKVRAFMTSAGDRFALAPSAFRQPSASPRSHAALPSWFEDPLPAAASSPASLCQSSM